MAHNQLLKKIFQSRATLITLLILTIVSGLQLANEITRRSKITAEINRLQSEIERLNEEQTELSSVIEYLQTDEYIELEARKKLNRGLPGEEIVVVTGIENEDNTSQIQPSNVSSWVAYFFNTKI